MSRLFLSAALALSSASYALGQAAAPTLNPLNEFIGAAGSAASVINSARARETAAAASASSAAAAASPTTTPAAKPSNSHRNMIIAIVCAVVGVILLLAIVLGVCCFLKRHGGRRRRNQKRTALDDDEKTVHHSEPIPPLNPGRTYSPLAQNRGVPSASPKPKVPLVAATNQYPAQREQNPFVPVPPSPRKPAYSNSAFIDPNPRAVYHDSYTTNAHESYSTAQPYLTESSPLRTTSPRSRSNSRPRSGIVLPSSTAAERPPTPYGLRGIGQPYDDMHVHVLESESPSSDFRRSVHDPDPLPRHHTPPQLPSRSPHRGINTFADSSYQSSTDSSTTNSGSGEDWRRSHIGSGGGASWAPAQTRYSNGASGAVLPGPLAPWDHTQHPGRHSNDSPRNLSTGKTTVAPWTAGHDRRGSATSINGQPRRLRFSDLQADNGGIGIARSCGPVDSRDDHRYPQGGVGEAL